MHCLFIYFSKCFYAEVLMSLVLQISKALAGADRKDLMRKLPKFIYDEEKTLELHGDDAPNGAAVNSNEVGASM
ncbi:hypothetical protein CFP56_014119 [Quercus suber]|uniref:Uncharacterized protein n=1 Tax=Quercus suber TaxID=58331 RepID=A0AAW0KTI5_QUESU